MHKSYSIDLSYSFLYNKVQVLIAWYVAASYHHNICMKKPSQYVHVHVHCEGQFQNDVKSIT